MVHIRLSAQLQRTRHTLIPGSPVGVCEHVAAVFEYVAVTENDEAFVAEGVWVAEGSGCIENDPLNVTMPEWVTAEGKESVLMGMSDKGGIWVCV